MLCITDWGHIMPGANRRTVRNKDGQWVFDGYRYDEDDVANQMAYLFAGEEGSKRAKAIRTEAEQILDPVERKQFIETKIKEKGTEVDTGLQEGMMGIIGRLHKGGGDLSGEAAGKSDVVKLMQGLGLNVNSDNVQTNYSPGPPEIYMITFVNRPTPELKDPSSEISQLSQCYANSLTAEEKPAFQTQWDQQVEHAKAGGPIIEKSQFEFDAAISWSEFKKEVKEEQKQAIDEAVSAQHSASPRL